MKTTRNMLTVVMMIAAIGLAATAAQAGLVGQLGILDEAWFTANPTNPDTSAPWQAGDTYHLAFVTLGTRNGISADIGDYNAFVQAAADAAGIGATESVTWKAIGSTATVDAKDNAVVSAPVYNLGPELVATGYAHIWDGSLTSAILYTEYGEIPSYSPYPPARFAWTGSNESGEADRPLGVAKPMVGGSNDTNSEWIAVRWAACLDHEGFRLYGLSAPLTVAGGGGGPDPVYGPIAIVNGSFELPNRGDGGYGPADGWVEWNIPGADYVGNWNPESGDFPAGAPEGDHVAWSWITTGNPSGLSQTLSATLQENTEYELMVEVGNDATYASNPGYIVQLLADDVVLAEDNNSLTIPEGEFLPTTISYMYDPAHAALLGKPLEIRLLNAGLGSGDLEIQFDDVRLTAKLIPEPATLALLGLAACGLGGYVRRRRRA